MTNAMLNENGDVVLNENGGKVVAKIDWTPHNAIIDALLPDIEAYQDAYILSHPYYFQGLPTHTGKPIEDTASDRLAESPTGKTTTWNDTGLSVGTLPFSMQIHEYVTPAEEKGYQVIFTCFDGEHEYSRSVGYGAESVGRTYDWSVVT